MAISNRDRIGRALDEIRDGLLQYISIQLSNTLGPRWKEQLPQDGNNLQDVSILLGLFMTHWAGVFRINACTSSRRGLARRRSPVRERGGELRPHQARARAREHSGRAHLRRRAPARPRHRERASRRAPEVAA